MTDALASTGDEPTAVYEIRLRGGSAEPLRRRFPSATVLTTRTETVLFRRVEEPSELDELIENLLSMGLVLTEVHELLLPSQTAGGDEGPPSGPSINVEEHPHGNDL
jgi:hypothetical protein